MKLLKDILYGVGLTAVSGSTNVMINTLCFDSRNVGLDDVFVAIKGTLTDGHKFIEKPLILELLVLYVKSFQINW